MMKTSETTIPSDSGVFDDAENNTVGLDNTSSSNPKIEKKWEEDPKQEMEQNSCEYDFNFVEAIDSAAKILCHTKGDHIRFAKYLINVFIEDADKGKVLLMRC
ncbi:hypothetical protein Pyn_13076 [Prunus yedoensis var. nudiflora]|uniref:Uncharacterized protein n=1 Tax=Prunus yedoensis var. nudiflora TaxID=2094558 RepID=A0A314UQV8_PRUYE|nr:hypothetical protein Pyn_13076 [Prunus yedoensis var. nudiflora]